MALYDLINTKIYDSLVAICLPTEAANSALGVDNITTRENLLEVRKLVNMSVIGMQMIESGDDYGSGYFVH